MPFTRQRQPITGKTSQTHPTLPLHNPALQSADQNRLHPHRAKHPQTPRKTTLDLAQLTEKLTGAAVFSVTTSCITASLLSAAPAEARYPSKNNGAYKLSYKRPSQRTSWKSNQRSSERPGPRRAKRVAQAARPAQPTGVWGWTSGSQTYIRARPGVQTPPVAKIGRHTKLFIWGKFDGWYRVETTDNKFGWVYHTYINSPEDNKIAQLSHRKAKIASDRTAYQTMYGSPELLRRHYARFGAPGAKRGLEKMGVRIVTRPVERAPLAKAATKPQLVRAPRPVAKTVSTRPVVATVRVDKPKIANPVMAARRVPPVATARRDHAVLIPNPDLRSGSVGTASRALAPSFPVKAVASGAGSSMATPVKAPSLAQPALAPSVEMPANEPAETVSAPPQAVMAPTVVVPPPVVTKPAVAQTARKKTAPSRRYTSGSSSRKRRARRDMSFPATIVPPMALPKSTQLPPISPDELLKAREDFLQARPKSQDSAAETAPRNQGTALFQSNKALVSPSAYTPAGQGSLLTLPILAPLAAPYVVTMASYTPSALRSAFRSPTKDERVPAALRSDTVVGPTPGTTPKEGTAQSALVDIVQAVKASPKKELSLSQIAKVIAKQGASNQTANKQAGTKQKVAQQPYRGGSPRDYALGKPADNKPLFGMALSNQALSYRGMPYISGASSPRRGFDCSGLVYYLLRQRGYNPPRTAAGFARYGEPVKSGQWQAGDLLLFANTYKRGVSHIGIYMGDGKFVHAANHGLGVTVSSLTSGYYTRKYYGARRVK